MATTVSPQLMLIAIEHFSLWIKCIKFIEDLIDYIIVHSYLLAIQYYRKQMFFNFNILFSGTTIITLTLIAFNRYKLVLDIGAYKQLYTRRNIILMLMVAWLVPALCLTPALVGIWGQFGYVPMMVTCNLLLDHRSQLFKIFLLVVRAVLPCFLIVYYYARIYHATRKSHQRIGGIGRIPSSLDVHNHAKEMHMTRMMLIIFLVFSLSYFPCTVTGMIDWNIVLSKQYHMFCQISIYLGSAANPLVYGLMNSQFRKAYRELVCCFNIYLNSYSLTSTRKSSLFNSSNQIKGKSNSRTSSDLQSGIYPLLLDKHCNSDSKPTSEDMSANNSHESVMINVSTRNEKRPTFTLDWCRHTHVDFSYTLLYCSEIKLTNITTNPRTNNTVLLKYPVCITYNRVIQKEDFQELGKGICNCIVSLQRLFKKQWTRALIDNVLFYH